MPTQDKPGAGERTQDVPQTHSVELQLSFAKAELALALAELDETKAQRDELLAALERIASDKEFTHRVNDEFIRKVWYVEEAKRAISQATGRAQ